MSDSQLPEEREPNLLCLKYSIVAMIFFAFGRAVCAVGAGAVPFDGIAVITMLLSMVMGLLLLKDDQHLRGFYKCLSETICQVCADVGEGGMQCLIPFIMMTLVNVLFDFIQRMAYLQIMPYGICLAGSIISQAFAVYFACCIYKRIRVPPGEMEMGGFGSGDYNYDQVNRGDAPAQQGFQPKREDISLDEGLEEISLDSPSPQPQASWVFFCHRSLSKFRTLTEYIYMHPTTLSRWRLLLCHYNIRRRKPPPCEVFESSAADVVEAVVGNQSSDSSWFYLGHPMLLSFL